MPWDKSGFPKSSDDSANPGTQHLGSARDSAEGVCACFVRSFETTSSH